MLWLHFFIHVLSSCASHNTTLFLRSLVYIYQGTTIHWITCFGYFNIERMVYICRTWIYRDMSLMSGKFWKISMFYGRLCQIFYKINHPPRGTTSPLFEMTNGEKKFRLYILKFSTFNAKNLMLLCINSGWFYQAFQNLHTFEIILTFEDTNSSS